MKFAIRGVVVATFSLLVACDERPVQEYFSVRADLRRCASPVCGGFWFKAVNRANTRCFDDTLQSECYAGDIDFSALGLSDEQAAYAHTRASAGKLVLKGQFATGSWPSFASIAKFAAKEAWDAGTDQAPAGTYFLAHEEPIVCVTFPCPNVTGTKLNTTPEPTRLYDGVDLGPSGATPKQIELANQHLQAEGLVLAATTTSVTGPAGTVPSLVASQYYVKLSARTAQACRHTGCSGQICSDRDVVTTCEFRPEYACYASATCERQASGACGFTPTPELEACLGGAASN